MVIYYIWGLNTDICNSNNRLLIVFLVKYDKHEH